MDPVGYRGKIISDLCFDLDLCRGFFLAEKKYPFSELFVLVSLSLIVYVCSLVFQPHLLMGFFLAEKIYHF